MSILRLAAQLTLDGTRFKSSLRDAQVAARNFSGEMAASLRGSLAAAFGTAAIAAAAKKTIDFASSLKDAALATRVSTGALQEQLHWAAMSGAGLDDLTKGYLNLSKARDAALSGDEKRLETFQALGVDEAMLRAGELQQIFERIAATAEKTDFGGDTLPILESVLGKAALTLAPALTTSLQDAAKEARSLGLVLEDALIDSLEGTGDELDKVVARLRGPLAAALGEILSKASDLATYVKLFAGSGITFMKETGSTLSPSAGAEAVRKHWNKTLEDWEVSKGLRAPDGAPDGEPARVKGLRARLQDETNGGKGDAAARTAEREQESIARAKERIFQIDLRSMAAAQKRVALEKHIGELMERREAMRKAGAPESEILEMEAKIKEAAIDHDGTFDEKGKPSLGDVSSLTQLGKLSARDQFVNADPVVPLNKMVDLVREQLNIDRQTLMVMNRLSEQQWARLRSSV